MQLDILKYLSNRKEGDILVDLREREIFNFGTIAGAINIPLGEIQKLYDLPKDSKIYLFCQSGDLSGEIAELLSDAGYSACNLLGGFRKYLANSNIVKG